MTNPTNAEDLIRDAYREAVGMCDSEGLSNHTLHMEEVRILAAELWCAITKLGNARAEIDALKAEKEDEKE